MNLYILRHGQTDYNLMGKFQGQIDIPLNQKGEEQAREAASELSNILFDKVFSSPLKRAIRTAEIATKMDITIDERLKERSFGKLEGKESIADYEEKIEEYQIETVENLQKRVYSFLDEMIQKYKDCENILVATHICVAQIIDCYFSKRSYEEMLKDYKLGNGKYKKYIIGGIEKWT